MLKVIFFKKIVLKRSWKREVWGVESIGRPWGPRYVSKEMMWIRPDPDPQHCYLLPNLSYDWTFIYSNEIRAQLFILKMLANIRKPSGLLPLAFMLFVYLSHFVLGKHMPISWLGWRLSWGARRSNHRRGDVWPVQQSPWPVYEECFRAFG